MSTSPTLKTLWSGNHDGVAKASPSQASRAPRTAAEFAKCSPTGTRPAARNAAGEAGMTPPLAAMARALAAAPSPTSHSPGTRRLRTKKTPAST